MDLTRLTRLLYYALRGKTKAAILLFHRVAEVSETIGPDTQISLSPTVFEQVIQQLSVHFQPLPFSEVTSRIQEGRPLPKRAVAVTFDDGFRDNLTTARPILETYDVPAIFYITSGFVDGSTQSYEHLLARYIKTVEHVRLQWNGDQKEWELDTQEKREKCYRAIKSIGKPLSASRRKQLVNSLRPCIADSIDMNAACTEYMSPEEVSVLAQNPLFTVGAHTHAHPLLSSLSANEAQTEIRSGLNRVREMTNSPIRHFSYPYGGHSNETIEMVKSLKFESAVTTHRILADAWRHSLFQLPRIEIQEQSIIDKLKKKW